ncbi:MAG: hypothetical protein MJ187_02550 [Alphaproteobacteria bacterium]|nr:hypothetical protein [Alphaproteobacteria bacterium]
MIQTQKKIYKRVEELLSALNENTTELQDNAQAMRDKEQSTANKLLGAASMAATSIGRKKSRRSG